MTNVRRKTYRNIGRIEKVRGRIGRMVTINNGGRRRRLNGMLRRFGGCNSRRSHRRKRDCRSENWGFMSNGKGGWNLKRVGFLFWFYGYKQKRGKLIRVRVNVGSWCWIKLRHSARELSLVLLRLYLHTCPKNFFNTIIIRHLSKCLFGCNCNFKSVEFDLD